jgi:hypothetical protein
MLPLSKSSHSLTFSNADSTAGDTLRVAKSQGDVYSHRHRLTDFTFRPFDTPLSYNEFDNENFCLC